ncbi:hypothetical protein D3C75_373930 [compost metagenome]
MPMDDRTLDQLELKSFLDSFGDRQVRINEPVLLISPEKVFPLLEIQFRGVWEASRERRRGLPTYKTIQKLLVPGAAKNSQSSFNKLTRNIPTSRRAIQFLISEFDQGYSTPSLCSWLGMLELSNMSEPALDYWQEAFVELSQLGGPTFRSQPTVLDRYRAYDSAEITEKLGCPISRERLPRLLSEMRSEADIDCCPQLKPVLGADAFSVLLRLAAWLMADWQVTHWELQEREGTQNVIHAGWAIPRFCSASGTWSCPMEEALSKLAKLAGWKGKPNPVTYLGKLWAAIDNKPESSRIRLLRNWVQLRPGRPSFEMLTGLISTCMKSQLDDASVPTEERELHYWLDACIFRFAETLSRLLRDLHKEGCSSDLISSLMGVYETEYRTARGLLGKPLAD